jgi:subtilase family serine protease
MCASHFGHARSRLRPLLLSLLTLASLPRPLPAADIRVGEISYPGEQDAYSFRLETPATLYFDVLTNAGSINWSLSGPPGNVVVNRDFTGSDADGIGDPLLRLPDGDYTLTVAGSGSSAVGYRFQMLNFTDAALITMGTVVSNAPAAPLSTQLYQFTANAGDVVTFDSLGITGGTGPFWRLVDPYGRIVFANYFSDVNSLRLDATGNYTLLVESRIYGTPSAYGFQLNLISSTPPPAFTGTPLTLGAGVTNVIADAGATNAYTFTLAQPTRLYYDSLTNNGSLRYTLFGPGGTIATTRGVSGGANADLHRAPAGDYQLVLSAVSGYTGSFAFRLVDLATAVPITPGTVVNGSNAPTGSLKAYRFGATPGTRLYFDTLSQSGFTYFGTAFWSLMDPYGNVLFADHGFGDRATTTLTGNGDYTLWIAGGDHEPGAQGNFSFNLVPVTETSTALSLNTSHTGNVATPGQQHFYTFTLADTKRVFFQSQTNQPNVRWSLSGPAGVVQPSIAFNSGGWLAYTLGPGDYTITVFANGDATGGYAFKLVDYATAIPIAVGATVNGTLTPAASGNIHELPLTAGDRLYIDTLAQSGFTYFGTAFWRLEDPEGNTVFLPDINLAFDRGFGDIGPFIVPRTATYRLVILGAMQEPQPTANYSFRILPVTDATLSLALNTVIDAAITHPGQKLTYTFNVATPTRVTFDNLLSVPSLNWTLSTVGRTYAANVGFTSDGWYVYDLVPGAYQIVIQAGADNIGTARFALRDLATAQPLTLDSTIVATLTPPRESQLFRFTGTAGQRLFFDVLSQSGFTYYGAPAWRLANDANQALFDSYAHGDQGPLTLPVTGDYTLLVGGNVTEGQPQANFSFRILNSPSTTAALVLNALTTGTLGVPGEQHRFTFTLAQPTDVLFDSRTNNTMRWTLTGPTGVLVNDRSLNNSDGPNFDSFLRLPAGDHTLSLTTPGEVLGGYAFVLRTLDSGSALTLNTTVNGGLNPANATVLYQFNATAGDRMRFQQLSQTGIPSSVWRLRDPAGDLVWGNYFNGSIQSNLLARTGTYTLQLEGHVAEPNNGTFSFSTTTFTPTPPPGPSGTAITLGQTVSNTLPTAATVDSYLLTLSQPGRLYVDYLRPLDGFNWALIGPGGPVVAMHSVYTTLNPQLQSRLLPPGTYEFQITGVAAPYSFRILDAATAPLYTSGGVTNDVSPASGALLRRVNLVAGQRYYFDTLSESGFGSSPTKLLSGPAGNLLFNYSGGGDSGAFTAGQTGEHILVIDGQWGNTAPTGTIAFNLRSVIEITNALALGSSISNTLAGGGDQHHYSFSLATTNRVFFDALAYSAPGWQWSLSGPGGSLVQNRSVVSSDSYDLGDSSLWLLPGDYRLTINSSSDQPVPYQFRLLRDVDATPFVLGATVTTNHVPTTMTSLMRFYANAGQLVFFDSIPSGGYGPVLRLYSPVGTLLSSFGANGDVDTFTLPATGDYLISIEGRIYDTAPSGTVSFAFLPVTYPTNSLVLNTTTTGSISVPGTRQFWQFSLATPQNLWFDAITNFNAAWTLSRGANVLVASRGFAGSDSLDASDSLLRLPAGDYTIMVALGAANTGSYAFRLASPAVASPLGLDVNTAVTLDPPMTTRLLTFSGTAGDRYFFDGMPQTGSAGSAQARLYDPLGNLVLNVNTVSDQPVVTLPFTGTYVMSVEGRIYNTGAGTTANFALILNPPKATEPLFENTLLPDLVVTTASVSPPAGLKSGDPFTVNWTVRNNGAIATGGAFADRVSVRNVTLNQIILNTTLAYNPADAGNGPIAPATQRNRQLALTLPAGAGGAGSLEVTVTTDTANQIAEYNAGGTGESNNSTTTPFSSTLAPYPDLQVIALAAHPATGWATGTTVQFTWGITNTGPAAAGVSWVDRVIVRNTSRSVVLLATNVVHDATTEGALTAGGRRNREAQFTVPAGLNGQGRFEITVETDALAQVVEAQPDSSGEDNNRALLTLDSAPDLQVPLLTVTASPTAQSGANLLVEWTLQNTGNAPVETAFADRVLVRRAGDGATLVNTTAGYNPGAAGSGTIPPGGTRARALTVKLPDGPAAAGALEIEVAADTFNQVFELTGAASGEGNNVATVNLQTTLAPYPDLLATRLSVTPSNPQSGQELTLRWEVANQGDAPVTGNWHDRVQLVNTATGATLLDTSVLHNTGALGPLTNGTARLRQYVFRLPNGAAGAGPLRLTLTADGLNSVFEYNVGGTGEANNASTFDFNAALAAYPDLEIAAFSVAPATFESGRLLTATWGVTNTGTAAVTGDFFDRVLVRNLTAGTTLFDQSYYLNPVADTNGPIAPGQSRLRSASFRLPDGPAGAGNIDVALFLDSGNRVFEFREGVDAEANNTTNLTRSSTIALYPDLAVNNVTAPPTGLPGQTIDVGWTVANQGAAATPGGWTDQVFLVDDAQPNAPQLLGTFPFGEALAAAGSSNVTRTVTLPFFTVGTRRLAVRANAGPAFFEPDLANNYAPAAATIGLSPRLELTLNRSSVPENGGANSAFFTVLRNGATTADLTVSLTSSDPDSATLPASVTVPAGQTHRTVAVTLVNNGLVDGDRTVTFGATAAGYSSATVNLLVQDDDLPALTLQTSRGVVQEDEGPAALLGYLSRNTSTNTALTVSVVSDSPTQLRPPATVTIPAGQRSVAFDIDAPVNTTIEGPREVRLQASVPGFRTGTAVLTVIDNDAPAIALELAAAAVVEGAESPATTGRLTRQPPLTSPLNVVLGQSLPGLLLLPGELNFAAGQSEVVFNINVTDDTLVNGSRTNVLSARVRGALGVPITNGEALATLVAFDNDGPSLTLTLARDVVGENGSVAGTVSRNTGTAGSLVVNLTSSDSGEAVPASPTVTIPGGQTSAPFTIQGVPDGVNDGIQPVIITASANGFNSATARLNVTDIDLPDLAVGDIIVPSSGQIDARANVTYTVMNSGPVAAVGPWVDRVYISTDNQLGGDVLAGAFTNTVPLAANSAYSRTLSITLPADPARYHIIVITDAANQVEEGSERNNVISFHTIDVQPSYRATVETDVVTAPCGTPVPVRGRAFNPDDNSPARFKLVTVRVLKGGTRRLFNVFTDLDGTFQMTFTPLPTETGDYQLAADHPRVNDDVPQDGFSLLGFSVSAEYAAVTLVPETPVSGQVTLRNETGVPLTGLVAAAPDAPAALGLQLNVPATVPGHGTVTLDWTLNTTITNAARVVFPVLLTSAEGCARRVLFTVSIAPLRPQLVAEPAFLSRGMVRGEQALVPFTVRNIGGVPSGALDVLLPANAWLKLAGTNRLESLEPGNATTVNLLLEPATDLPLIIHGGTIAINGASSSLAVPFQFRALSTAQGDLKITVTDDYTYYVEGSPKVTNAVVTISDPFTGQTVTNKTTDVNGEARFVGLAEGAYTVDVTAPKRNSFRGTALIQPGVETALEAFLIRQTVTYRWSVVPVEVEDRYKIVLESVFEADVPIPNVIVEEPFIMPLVFEGETNQFEITLRNEGLIAAENVELIVPDHPDYLIEPLVRVIGTIPAKSRLTIPVLISVRGAAPAPRGLQLAGLDSRPRLHSGGNCEVGVAPCLPKIGLGVNYYYVCGANGVLQQRSIDLSPVCLAKDIKECVEKTLKSAGSLHSFNNGGNAANFACDLLQAVLQCAGVNLTPCQSAALSIACGAATGGLAGAGSGAAGGSTLECLCGLVKNINISIPPAQGGGYGTVNYVNGPLFGPIPGGYGGHPHSVGWNIGPGNCASPSPQGFRPGGTAPRPSLMNEGVCARVRIQIDQEAVLTRVAFKGSLEIENDSGAAIAGLRVDLDVRDDAGNPAGDRFVVAPPVVTGMGAVDGTGVVGAFGLGRAEYLFRPTRDAAPNAPAVYRIGGSLRYLDNGQEVVVPLLSATITVYPEARLELHYFQARNVYSDDPFTDELEPAEPFALGLLARNLGAGPARNFRITSAQPKIIENEKGLLIDFKIIGSQVGTNTAEPSLTVNLGTIPPGGSQVAQWLMTSSLQGKFIEYKATFEHLDNFGSTNLSLIDSVQIHELIKSVLADRPGDDRAPDFLVNDIPDPDSLPDILYLSDGSTALVTATTAGSFSNAIGAGARQTTLTFTPAAGWQYVTLPNPGPGWRLHRVVRSDQKEIQVGTNAWTTDRTFPSAISGVVREHRLHLFDHNSTGSYTLFYRPVDTVPPTLVAVGPVTPSFQTAAVAQVEVIFSEEIDAATFGPADVMLRRDGGPNLVNAGVTFTQTATNRFVLGGLTALTGADGNYELTVDATGIEDFGGNGGLGTLSTSWAKGALAPVVTALGPVTPSPRNTPVDGLEAAFSRALNTATFTREDLTLTRNGGANLIDSGVTVNALDPDRFLIAGLTALTQAAGDYVLTLNAAGLEDTEGNAGAGVRAVSWSMITSGPRIVAVEQPATNPRNIVVTSLDVTFAAPINPATFNWQDVTLTRDGGPNLITSGVTVQVVSPTVYRVANFNWVAGQEGGYVFTAAAAGVLDPAGNAGAGTASAAWQMDTTRPLAPTALALSPDLGVADNDGLINTLAPTLTGALAETNLTVRVKNLTTGVDYGTAVVTGTGFAKPLALGVAGAHKLEVRAIDAAGNASFPDATIDLFVDLTRPSAVITPVTPAVRDSAVSAVTVTFSEPLNPATLTREDFTLRRQGGANLINSGVQVVNVVSNLYQLTGLTALTDSAGNYELALNLATVEDRAGNAGTNTIVITWSRTGANQPPVLTAIADRAARVGQLITFTNFASDPDPGQRLRFSLNIDAPANARLGADNGVFAWTPTRSQSPGVYALTVTVTDDGVPPASASRTFVVGVEDYTETSLGEVVLLAGEDGALNLTLISTAGLTNLIAEVAVPTNRLHAPQLAGLSPLVGTSALTELGDGRYRVSLTSPAGLSIRGSNVLAQLAFASAADQPSAFLPLPLSNITARQPDGSVVGTTFVRDGRVVMIGGQPLLETVRTTDNSRFLRLFARPGDAHDLLSASTVTGPWTAVERLRFANREVHFAPGGNGGNAFFRLASVDTSLPFFEILSADSAGMDVVFYADRGLTYDLQTSSNLNLPWTTQLTRPMTNQFHELRLTVPANESRFLRARSQ